MMRCISIVFSLTLLPLLLSGCWDSKNMSELLYANAIGVDYQKGEYVVYVQFMDFSVVGKQKEGKIPEGETVWIGKGKGKTAGLALNDLYNTSQQPIYWGYVTGVLLSENILKTNIDEVLEPLNRRGDIRYTTWIYGTKDPLEKILSVVSLHKNPYQTLLHTPLDPYQQNSEIRPIRLHEFLSQHRDESQTVLLPSLSIQDQYKQGSKPIPLMNIDGVFPLHKKRKHKWLSYAQDLTGLRWLTEKTTHALIEVNKRVIQINQSPTISITPSQVQNKPTFKIQVGLKGTLFNMGAEKISENELEIESARKVKSEIENTYQAALKDKVDIYNLEHILYKKDHPLWKNIRDEKGIKLNEDSIKVSVDVKINRSGRYK